MGSLRPLKSEGTDRYQELLPVLNASLNTSQTIHYERKYVPERVANQSIHPVRAAAYHEPRPEWMYALQIPLRDQTEVPDH